MILDNTLCDPQTELDKAVLDLVNKEDGPHQTHLLIVYYTGHAFLKAAKPDELLLAG